MRRGAGVGARCGVDGGIARNKVDFVEDHLVGGVELDKCLFVAAVIGMQVPCPGPVSLFGLLARAALLDAERAVWIHDKTSSGAGLDSMSGSQVRR